MKRRFCIPICLWKDKYSKEGIGKDDNHVNCDNGLLEFKALETSLISWIWPDRSGAYLTGIFYLFGQAVFTLKGTKKAQPPGADVFDILFQEFKMRLKSKAPMALVSGYRLFVIEYSIFIDL